MLAPYQHKLCRTRNNSACLAATSSADSSNFFVTVFFVVFVATINISSILSTCLSVAFVDDTTLALDTLVIGRDMIW